MCRSGTEFDAGELVNAEDMVGKRSDGAEKFITKGFCGRGHCTGVVLVVSVRARDRGRMGGGVVAGGGRSDALELAEGCVESDSSGSSIGFVGVTFDILETSRGMREGVGICEGKTGIGRREVFEIEVRGAVTGGPADIGINVSVDGVFGGLRADDRDEYK